MSSQFPLSISIFHSHLLLQHQPSGDTPLIPTRSTLVMNQGSLLRDVIRLNWFDSQCGINQFLFGHVFRPPMSSLAVHFPRHTVTAMKWQWHRLSLQTAVKTHCTKASKKFLCFMSRMWILTRWFRKSWYSSPSLWFGSRLCQQAPAKLLSPQRYPSSFSVSTTTR